METVNTLGILNNMKTRNEEDLFEDFYTPEKTDQIWKALQEIKKETSPEEFDELWEIYNFIEETRLNDQNEKWYIELFLDNDNTNYSELLKNMNDYYLDKTDVYDFDDLESKIKNFYYDEVITSIEFDELLRVLKWIQKNR